MESLSSCYFCGTAIEAPLSEVPVVPEALHPSTVRQRTVVLCPTCERKLETVVDSILDAVAADDDDGGSTAITLRESARDAAAAGSKPGGESDADAQWDADEIESNDGSAGDDTVDADPGEDQSGGGQSGDEVTPEPRHTTSTGAGIEPGNRRFEVVDDGSEDEAADDGSDEDDGFGGDEETADDGPGVGISAEAAERLQATASGGLDDGDDAEDGATTDPDDDEAPGSDTADAAEAADAGESAGSETTDDADETPDEAATSTPGSSGGESPDRPPAAKYNKVIRLLQNREFPVDRDEIRVVAQNAYGISPEEFDAIVDYAVDRGAMGADGNKLTRP